MDNGGLVWAWWRVDSVGVDSDCDRRFGPLGHPGFPKKISLGLNLSSLVKHLHLQIICIINEIFVAWNR